MTDMSVPPGSVMRASDFPNLFEQEAVRVASLQERLAKSTAELHRIDACLSLRQAPGWRAYLEVLGDRLNNALNAMVQKSDPHGLAVAQGRCREAAEMSDLMRNWGDSRQALAKQIAELETELRSLEQQGARR